jgi:hypothetical protein
MSEPLKYLSEDVLRSLRERADEHVERYRSGDFLDLASENGWAIETRSVSLDLDLLAKLNGDGRSAEADAMNSKLVFAAMSGMTPAIAADERIWTRLSHLECLSYSRQRWLAGNEDEALKTSIRKHMFAEGRTGVRDDHALSRLWWNMRIATIADPDDPEGALDLILKRADIRMQLVERPNTAARYPIIRAIVRAMRRDPAIVKNDKIFREFMMILNREGGGVLFEAWNNDTAVDDFMQRCCDGAIAAGD